MTDINQEKRTRHAFDRLEYKLLSKSPIQPGDVLRVLRVTLDVDKSLTGQLARVYYLVFDDRSQEEELLTAPGHLYDVMGEPKESVSHIYQYLYGDAVDPGMERRAKLIELLKAAGAIPESYSENIGEQSDPNKVPCGGGCGGTTYVGYKYCPGCQKGADFIHSNALRLSKERADKAEAELERLKNEAVHSTTGEDQRPPDVGS
jgi:hypothetical protein